MYLHLHTYANREKSQKEKHLGYFLPSHCTYKGKKIFLIWISNSNNNRNQKEKTQKKEEQQRKTSQNKCETRKIQFTRMSSRIAA